MVFPVFGTAKGTRFIIVSIPSSRNRVSVRRTLTFISSTPFPGSKKADTQMGICFFESSDLF